MGKNIALVFSKKKSRSRNNKAGSENQDFLQTYTTFPPRKWSLSPTQKQMIQITSETQEALSGNVLIFSFSSAQADQSRFIPIKRIPKRPIQADRCLISHYPEETKRDKRRQTHQQIQPPKKQPKQRQHYLAFSQEEKNSKSEKQQIHKEELKRLSRDNDDIFFRQR